MKKALLAGLAIGLMVIGASGNSEALTIQGALWAPSTAWSINPGSAGENPIDPTATFTVDAINFDSRIGGVDTYQEFLQGGLSNINNLIWGNQDWSVGTLGTPGYLDRHSFYTASGIGSFFQFKGTGYFSANTLVTHDDGFWLKLDGTVFDRSEPVYAKDTIVGNEAGNYEFIINYGAYNGFPEVLITKISDPVPEPATMLLFGAGLAGLAGSRLRRKK